MFTTLMHHQFLKLICYYHFCLFVFLSDSNCVKMLDLGVVPHILTLLERHVDQGDVSVQHAGLSALRNLAIPGTNWCSAVEIWFRPQCKSISSYLKIYFYKNNKQVYKNIHVLIKIKLRYYLSSWHGHSISKIRLSFPSSMLKGFVLNTSTV